MTLLMSSASKEEQKEKHQLDSNGNHFGALSRCLSNETLFSIVNILHWIPYSNQPPETISAAVWKFSCLFLDDYKVNGVRLIKMQLLGDGTRYRNSLSSELGAHQKKIATKQKAKKEEEEGKKKLYDHLSLFRIIFKLIWLCLLVMPLILLM